MIKDGLLKLDCFEKIKLFSRPTPILTSDGEKQWEECNDLINNKGCIKQVVNDGK